MYDERSAPVKTMAPSNSESAQNTFNISGSTITNMVGSGTIHYGESSEKAVDSVNSDDLKKVILFLAANPVATSRLRLDEEVREIEAGLQRAKHRDRFTLQQKWAVRPRDLQRAMLDCQPQIIHFSGHGIGGTTDTGLILEDITGQPKLVSTEALTALFKLFERSVECVVLNACYSEQQAKAIAQHIPYVIGMNEAIGDRAAIEFSIGFYDALGAGESVEQAYESGLTSIRMAGISEHLTPVMVRYGEAKLNAHED